MHSGDTTNLFGTTGSCTCGFADVAPELPCAVHPGDLFPAALAAAQRDLAAQQAVTDTFFDDTLLRDDELIEEPFYTADDYARDVCMPPRGSTL